MRISDWSSDVCSSDLRQRALEIVEFGIFEARQQRIEAVAQLGLVGRRDRPDRAAVERHVERDQVMPLRSEEHTSELQSLMRISYAVFCLKKKQNTQTQSKTTETHEPPQNIHLSN